MLTGTLPDRSNKANWLQSIEVWDDDAGAAVDLSTAADITVALRDENGSEALSAKLSAGTVTLAADNLSASFNFTRSQMQALCAKTYEVGIRVVFITDTDEQQLVLGRISILKGL